MKGKIFNKKALTITAIVLAAAAVLIGGLSMILSSCGGPSTYTGYLICQDCGMQGKCAADNLDVTVNPEKHTLKCLKMPDCIMSGYGIAIKQENGKYKYFAFDTDGSIMAVDNIVYQTKRIDNLLVDVKGRMENNIIMVTSIAQK